MMVATYIVNLLCAVVECRGSMSPPEAYIAEYTQSPLYIPRETTRSSIDLLNYTDEVTYSSYSFSGSGRDESSYRRKRLFPLPTLNSNNRNRLPTADNEIETSESYRRKYQSPATASQAGYLQTKMSTLFNSIPSFVSSVSRIMQNRGNDLADTFSFRTGRRIDNVEPDKESRNAFGDLLPVVYLQHGGGVEGYYMGTMNGRKIAAYEGIPYGEPPVGNRRFKPPVPQRPWHGIRKAQKPGNMCLQTHPLYFFRVTGNEDCLFANVYSVKIPYINESKLYPVVIYIHGGSFIFGSGSEYGPSYLLDQDVILVTFNYRLGALGFLSTGDLESPGNYGLKDQALLIEWVHENIQRFGGDPSRISLTGQSAGAVSSHLHLIANKTTQYFHNGVSLSGSGFGFWPVQTRQRAVGRTRSLAKRLNCPHRSTSELTNCLKGLSGAWITISQLQLFNWLPLHPLVLFGPVVEPEGPSSYLTKWPAEAYANHEVEGKPWIFGQTLNEGHFETYILRLAMQAPNIAFNVKRYLPKILDYEYITSDPGTRKITERLMEFYGGRRFDSGLEMDALSDMYTDRYFSNTIRKAIRAHSAVVPRKTFAYVYDFVGKYNLGELFGVPRAEWSSAHTEDCLMIFNSSSFHHGLSKKDVDYQLTEIMTNVLANFAASGEPVYQRPATGNENGTFVKLWESAIMSQNEPSPRIQYLRFGNDVRMRDDPYYSRIKFWETLGIPT